MVYTETSLKLSKSLFLMAKALLYSCHSEFFLPNLLKFIPILRTIVARGRTKQKKIANFYHVFQKIP